MRRVLLSLFMLIAFAFSTIDAEAVAAPTGVASQDVINDNATITWNTVVDAVKYNVLQDGSKIGDTTGLKVDVSGLVVGTPYTFNVQAVDIFDNVSANSADLDIIGGQDGHHPGKVTNVFVIGSVPLTVTAVMGGTSDSNLIEIAGTAVSVGSGTADAGTQRVSIATDDVVSIDDNGGSITVDGTVAATQSGSWSVGITSAPTGASSISVQGTVADGVAVVGSPFRIAGKDGGGLTQDIITDADGHLQIDAISFPGGIGSDSESTPATANPVLIAGWDTGGNVQNVLTNNGGILVSGFQSGNTVNQATALGLTLVDDSENPGQLETRPFMFDSVGGNFDALVGESVNGQDVDVTRLPPLVAGSASIGTLGANSGVDIGDVTINNAGAGAAVNIQDGGNVISIDDAGGSLTVDGTVTTTPPSNASTNITQLGGIAITLGSGVVTTGTQRVSIATDDVVSIDDGGGSITIDGTVAATQSGTWTIDNASGASAVNIQDGGNSITIDGTVTATVDVGATVDHAAITVGNTATLILASSGTRRTITISNAFSDTVAIGNSDVTLNTAASTDGFVLAKTSGGTNNGTGGSFTITTTSAIYGIGSSASSKVIYFTESD